MQKASTISSAVGGSMAEVAKGGSVGWWLNGSVVRRLHFLQWVVVGICSLQLVCAMLTVTCADSFHLPSEQMLHKLASKTGAANSHCCLNVDCWQWMMMLPPPFTAFCTCVMHFHAIYNRFPLGKLGHQEKTPNRCSSAQLKNSCNLHLIES